jgi:hypothetical protein
MKRRLIFSALIAIILHTPSFAQSVPADSTQADSLQAGHSFWSRYTLSKVGAVALVGGTLAYGAGVWWVHDTRPFHFWDAGWWEDSYGVDKIGHLYTSYYMFHAINDLLLWGGHEKQSSFWWATGVTAFHGLAIEIGDGFSDYGFDYRDVLSNYAGMGYGMLQDRVPFFRNFEIKWSLYYPLSRHAFKVNALYDYHIYWMSARVENLLPEGAKPYWPDWLQIAFGLGTKDHSTRRTYVLSFDYNLEAIPLEGRDIGLFKKLLNLFHLPAPGVRFSKGHPPEFQLLLLN